jgi:N utilization substance protein B
MISRRNLRIKVLHTIYELGQQNEQPNATIAKKYFDSKLEDTTSLLAAVTHLLYVLTEYVLIHANQKASKHIPTADDLNVNTKLAGNIIIQKLKKNESFSLIIKKNKLANLFDDEFIKKIFISLLESPEYKAYLSNPERNSIEEKKILETIIHNFIFKNEHTTSFLEEHFINWDSDFEMVESWMDKILITASNFSFERILSNEKLEFSHELIDCYYTKKDTIFALIEPKLVNWDAERVALLDLIILHLGICELLYFPSIPVKVTINEYIDLAKSFSTLQSGQFVNGLLDNVRKELMADNKIFKNEHKGK